MLVDAHQIQSSKTSVRKIFDTGRIRKPTENTHRGLYKFDIFVDKRRDFCFECARILFTKRNMKRIQHISLTGYNLNEPATAKKISNADQIIL
jgi:hypothetical protein